MNTIIEVVDSDCNFIFSSRPCYVHASFAASEALINYSIMLVRQVFTTGDEGVGIADNKNNREVNNFRINMNKCIKARLNWSDADHLEFSALIRDNRNQLVAHYSGKNANFEVVAPGVTSRKMVGAHVSNTDIEKLKIYIEAMCFYIEENLKIDCNSNKRVW